MTDAQSAGADTETMNSDVQSFQSGGNLIIRTDRDGQWIEGTCVDVKEVR